MEIWSLKEYLSVDSVFPYQEHKIIDAMIDDSGYWLHALLFLFPSYHSAYIV